jgi:hypothetical protein
LKGCLGFIGTGFKSPERVPYQLSTNFCNTANFDADKTITVKVNGIIARQVDRLSDTQILFTVPSRTPVLSPVPVEVTVGGVTKIGPDFTVTP